MKLVALFVCTAVSVALVGCSGAETGAASSEGEGEGDRPALTPRAEVAEAPVEARDEANDEYRAPAPPTVSFVAAEGCAGVAGTWRGEVYSDMHGAYYELTAHVAQPSPDDAALTGSIVARSWSGEVTDVAPPDACGDGFHWTVREDARGTLEPDGSFSFLATSWTMGEQICGDAVTGYSPDRLEHLTPASDEGETSKLTGMVRDGSMWSGAGMQLELTRIACD